MNCPIALCLERVGEWWSLLILRDALHGLTRFDEFQESLGISANSLTRRLKSLTSAGLLERRRYQDRPPRDEYLPTEAGRDLQPVLEALSAWGFKHSPPPAPATRLVDRETGIPVDPVLVDRNTGRPINTRDFVYTAGPGAKELRRKRLPSRPA
jgi:DNA-binding HxlR family transcriptional regulator